MLYGVENNRISRIDPITGQVSVFAGSISCMPGYQDAVGTNALFRLGSIALPPSQSQGAFTGIAISSNGVIYVVDPGNSAVRSIQPDATVSTLSNGMNIVGTSSPFGFGLNSIFNSAPTSNFLAVDSNDDLWLWSNPVGALFVISTRANGPNPAGTTSVAVINASLTQQHSVSGLVMSTPLLTISGSCAPGLYCPAGSFNSQGAGPCQAGYFCQIGASTPTGNGSCSPGQYSLSGASACSSCVRGFLSANGMSAIFPSPRKGSSNCRNFHA
jgi:hypothetical protein